MEIIKDILSNNYVMVMNSWIILYLPLYFILLFTYQRKKNFYKKLIFTAFFFYIWIVIDLTLTPFPITPKALTGMGPAFSWNTVLVLIPFRDVFIHPTYWASIMRPAFLNFIMFLPFGMLLPFFIKTLNYKKIVLYSFLFSLSIETLQLLLCLLCNASLRSFDTADIIMNTLGGVVGYFIFKTILLKVYWICFKKANPSGF